MVNHPRRSKKIPASASFHEGDIVTVYNSNLSGRPMIEGQAAIVGPGDVEDQYKVRFHNFNDKTRIPDRKTYFRFVYPGESQEHPNQYLAAERTRFEESQAKARAEYDAANPQFAF